MSRPLTRNCVYTILRPDRLAEAAKLPGPLTFEVKQRMVTAETLFRAAHTAGQDVAVLFGDATNCSRLIYWARAVAFEVGNSETRCTVSEVSPLPRVRRPQELVLVSTGEPIAEEYIKPYAVCRTPRFLNGIGRKDAPKRRSPTGVPEQFNPAIDRYDRRSAAKLFDSLWPDPTVRRAIAANLAASIRVAHAAADGSWAVTMFADAIRLNVGQVETLTLWDKTTRFIVRGAVKVPSESGCEINSTNAPVYPAVPVPSGICTLLSDHLPSLPRSVRDAHNAYLQAAASFKRVSPFKKSFSPAVLEHVEAVLGEQLPRPSYLTKESPEQRVIRLPDELDDTPTLFEGARYRVVVNAYERDPVARQLCIAKHGTTCVICGFSFGAVYGKVAEGFIHVHHLRPLSELGGEYQVNPVKDLRPVCPNCHAVLHRRVPAFSIEEVRTFLEEQRRSSSAGRSTKSQPNA